MHKAEMGNNTVSGGSVSINKSHTCSPVTDDWGHVYE